MKYLSLDDFNIYSSNNVTAYLKYTDFLHKLNKKSKILNCGRGYVIEINGYILRFYFHGGMLRFFFSDMYLSKNRFLSELNIHNYLFKNNFNVPEPVGVIFFRKFFWYHGVFISKKIENSEDLITYLINKKKINFIKIGKIVRKMHDLHVIHGDLHLKNFLIDENENLFLIDFDKSFFSENENDKIKNILRFFRSVYKFEYYNFEINRNFIDEFLQGYRCDNNLKEKIRINFFNKLSWKLNKPLYKKDEFKK